jgi:hypothetical protein
MTDAERAAQIQKLNQQLRNGQVDAGVARILKLLGQARREVLADVAETDWDRFSLPRKLAAIDRQLDHFRQLALANLKADMAHLWNLGESHSREAAKAIGIDVAFQELPTSLLQALQEKMGQRVSGLFQFAKDQLDQKISVALLTGQSREETIAAIGKILEMGSTGKPEGLFGSISARARFIYQQEVATAYAVAAAKRQELAAQYVPELQKVWAHDGDPKEPRAGHVAMHGQLRDMDEDFTNPDTGAELSYPRDPAADFSETANCTCSQYLWREEYGDVRQFIGDRSQGPITREDDQYNPGNYVVPGQPVVRGGAR